MARTSTELIITSFELKTVLIQLPKNILMTKIGTTDRYTPKKHRARQPHPNPSILYTRLYTLPSNVMTASNIAVVRIVILNAKLLALILKTDPKTAKRLSSSIGRNLASFRTRFRITVLNYFTHHPPSPTYTTVIILTVTLVTTNRGVMHRCSVPNNLQPHILGPLVLLFTNKTNFRTTIKRLTITSRTPSPGTVNSLTPTTQPASR